MSDPREGLPEVEESFRANQDEKVPAEVEARLKNRLAAFRQRMEQQGSRHEKENPIMSIVRSIYTSKLGWLSTAAVTTVVVLLALGILPLPHTSNLAFADVVKEIQALRTLTCDFSGTVAIKADGPTATTKGKSMWMAPGRTRNEVVTEIPEPSMHMEMIQIMDTTNGRSLTLMPQQKMAMELKIEGQTPEKKREMGSSFVDQIAAFRDGTETSLGTREIGGRQTSGFRVEKGGIVCDAWVATETGLPIEVTMELKMLGKSSTTFTNFVFDPPLDESLFSLTPPAGYTLMDTPKTVDASPSTERDLAAMFEQLRESGAEVFPKELTLNSCLEPLSKLMKDKVGNLHGAPSHDTPSKDAPSTQSLVKEITKNTTTLMLKVSRGVMFTQAMKPENDFRYLGKDVRFGEAEKPVCWWKPDGSKSYRVMFGDLSVRDVMPDNLPAVK
jgi:outer membrane lipoprotein-sorting protein